MNHYLMIVAPMDQTFVGPFADRNAARQWTREKIECGALKTYDYYIMSEEALKRNMEQYGPRNVTAPEEFV